MLLAHVSYVAPGEREQTKWWQIFELGSDWAKAIVPFLTAVVAGLTAYVESKKFWTRFWNVTSAVTLIAYGCYLVYQRLHS